MADPLVTMGWLKSTKSTRCVKVSYICSLCVTKSSVITVSSSLDWILSNILTSLLNFTGFYAWSVNDSYQRFDLNWLNQLCLQTKLTLFILNMQLKHCSTKFFFYLYWFWLFFKGREEERRRWGVDLMIFSRILRCCCYCSISFEIHFGIS